MSGPSRQETKQDIKSLTKSFNRYAINAVAFLVASAAIWFMAQNGRPLDLNPKMEAKAVAEAKAEHLSPEATGQLVQQADKTANDLEKIEWALGLNIAGIFAVLAAAKKGKLMASEEYFKTFAPRRDGRDGPNI